MTPPACPPAPAPAPGSAPLSQRLIPLCDGRPGLRAALSIEAQPVAQPTTPADSQALAVIDFVSSSATLDRYEEIIRPEGWQLDNYRRNPVFQNAHQYGDVIFTLGKALLTEVRPSPSPHLFQRIEFAVEVNPMARIAYGLYKHKFLNAVSVGFIPLRWQNEDGSEHASFEISNLRSDISEGPHFAAGEPVQGNGLFQRRKDQRRARRVYLEQELLEVSAVGIPANPEALQLGLKAGVVQKADLKELLDLLTESLRPRGPQPTQARTGVGATGHPPALETDASFPPCGTPSGGSAAARPPRSSAGVPAETTAQLLGFARALRDLLRHA